MSGPARGQARAERRWAARPVPLSAGTGGGSSEPSSAGRETMPAIAAAATAAARPTLAHLIRLPITSCMRAAKHGFSPLASPAAVHNLYSRASL